MNRAFNPFAIARGVLATALLTLAIGETAAVPAWEDSFTEPKVFEQDLSDDDLADPARPVVIELTDNQISEALFKDGPEPVDSPTVLAGFDPLQTP